MDFTRTEAQDDLADLTRNICDKLVTDERQRELDSVPGRVDAPLYAALAEAGVLAATLPEPVGNGYGPLEQSAILAELGRALASVPYLTSIVMAADALASSGSRDHADLAGRAARGEVVLTAALEESLTADPHAPATTATPVDTETAAKPRAGAGSSQGSGPAGGWVLSGAKAAVPFANEAAALLVSATVHGADGGDGGTAVFAVPADADGLTITREDATDHRSIGSVALEGVRVGNDSLIEGPDGSSAVLARLLERGTAGLCSEQFGVLQRALELTSAYAAEREQFGRPIGGFQAVGQRLADAFIDVKAARLTATQAAWRLAEGLDAADAVRIAKFWAADAGHRVAHTTIHVHGGVGLDRDHPVHRYFLAAKRGEFLLGSATAQLVGIGTDLAGH